MVNYYIVHMQDSQTKNNSSFQVRFLAACNRSGYGETHCQSTLDQLFSLGITNSTDFQRIQWNDFDKHHLSSATVIGTANEMGIRRWNLQSASSFELFIRFILIPTASGISVARVFQNHKAGLATAACAWTCAQLDEFRKKQ